MKKPTKARRAMEKTVAHDTEVRRRGPAAGQCIDGARLQRR